MEGLVDDVLRDVLTRAARYDLAVTEFVRVSGSLLPLRAFLRSCPELARASRTRCGTPVAVQLLGSDEHCLAENAAQLVALQPAGIDLNFGCPAPRVNRHGGGAMLLANPERLWHIAAAVRRVVPESIPLTAKMRLGIKDTALTLDCARALAAGGVVSLVVHARTRLEGYRPPAHWEWIARIADVVQIPVVANGEVWSVEDYTRCRSLSGVPDVMLGRGAVADPFLAERLRALASASDSLHEAGAHRVVDRAADRAADWPRLQLLLALYWRQTLGKVSPARAPGRLKLWLRALQRNFPAAGELFLALRSLPRVQQVSQVLVEHGIHAEHEPG